MLRTLARLPVRVTRRLLRVARRALSGRPPSTPPAAAPPADPTPAAPSAPSATPIALRVDVTPNPHALKFSADRRVVPKGSLSFNNADAAAQHPLGAALFAIDGVKLVFAVNDFITVTKREDVPWERLRPQVESALQRTLS